MKKILYKILLGINILFSCALLLSYLSIHINPVFFALPSLFGLAYPYILLINIILVIIWLMLLRYEALISVIVIAVGFTHFSNYIKIIRHGGSKAGTFKVMSYNIRMFNYLEGNGQNNSKKKIIEFIKTQKPDIICLQEFYEPVNPSEKIAEFKEALGNGYYYQFKSVGGKRMSFYGQATISKFPIINQGEIEYPGSSSLTLYADLLIGRDTIRLYNNHLQSFRLRKMNHTFFEAMTQADDYESFGGVKNLSLTLRKAFARRALQSETLKNHINRSPYHVIVAGDFNDTPVSYSYRKIRKGLNDSFVNSGYGAGFTYKGNYPPNRIDYILYDKSLINNYFEIVRIKYSDHYPIFAYFRRKN